MVGGACHRRHQFQRRHDRPDPGDDLERRDCIKRLIVPDGGTGLATLTSNVIYKGNGNGALAASGLTDNGTIVSSSESIDATGKSNITEIANAGTTGTTDNNWPSSTRRVQPLFRPPLTPTACSALWSAKRQGALAPSPPAMRR
jgi:alkaline phosphatase